MLLLILAHGHEVRTIEQNVRSHQAGIGKQTAIDIFRIFRAFILKLRHSRQLAEHGVALEHPAQLSVLMDVGLNKQRVFLGIETAGDILGQLRQGMAAEICGILADGDGVHICHKIIAVKLLGQLGPVFDGAKIRAQSQIAAGLNAGQENFFFIHNCNLLYANFVEFQ